MARDPHEVLGVRRGATGDETVEAYDRQIDRLSKRGPLGREIREDAYEELAELDAAFVALGGTLVAGGSNDTPRSIAVTGAIFLLVAIGAVALWRATDERNWLWFALAVVIPGVLLLLGSIIGWIEERNDAAKKRPQPSPFDRNR